MNGLTPDEYMRQRADRWHQTLMIRAAIAEGLAHARDDAASEQRLKAAPAAEVG